LDGQTVMAGLLPYHTAQRFDAFSAQYGTLLLWAVVLLGRPLLSVPIVYIAQGVLRVVSMLA
jgi:hypothetical protein